MKQCTRTNNCHFNKALLDRVSDRVFVMVLLSNCVLPHDLPHLAQEEKKTHDLPTDHI